MIRPALHFRRAFGFLLKIFVCVVRSRRLARVRAPFAEFRILPWRTCATAVELPEALEGALAWIFPAVLFSWVVSRCA
jgi:hypothetical protein